MWTFSFKNALRWKGSHFVSKNGKFLNGILVIFKIEMELHPMSQLNLVDVPLNSDLFWAKWDFFHPWTFFNHGNVPPYLLCVWVCVRKKPVQIEFRMFLWLSALFFIFPAALSAFFAIHAFLSCVWYIVNEQIFIVDSCKRAFSFIVLCLIYCERAD